MKEIREIFETVRTYCGMIFGENRAAKSVMGKMYCHALLSEGEKVAVRAERVTDTREGLSQISSLHNSPLSRISNAHSSSQRTATSSLGEVSSTTQQQPLSVVIPSLIRRVRSGCGKLGGLQDFSATTETRLTRMRNFSGIQPIKIERLVAYPSKSSLTREDLCYGKVALDNNPNSTETDHASMPLGILASKSVSCWHSNANLHLAAWLPSRLAAKKAAFTLAEVLITLGIIGVVAALTLPTLIQNHQKQVYVTQLKKAYSTLTNAYNELAAEDEVADWNQISCSDWYCLSDFLKHVKTIKSFEGCEEDWCNTYNSGIAGPTMVWGTSSGFITADGALFVFTCGSYLDSDYTWIVDVNGYNKGPNKPGRDIFQFALENLHKADDSWDPQNTGNKLIPVGAKTDYGYKTNDYIGEWGVGKIVLPQILQLLALPRF